MLPSTSLEIMTASEEEQHWIWNALFSRKQPNNSLKSPIFQYFYSTLSVAQLSWYRRSRNVKSSKWFFFFYEKKIWSKDFSSSPFFSCLSFFLFFVDLWPQCFIGFFLSECNEKWKKVGHFFLEQVPFDCFWFQFCSCVFFIS